MTAERRALRPVRGAVQGCSPVSSRVAPDTAAHPEPRVFDSASPRMRPIASSSSPAARAAATMGLASAVSRLRASGSSSFPARAPRYTASTSTSESRAATSAAAFRRTRPRVAFDTAAHPEPRVFDSASRRMRPITASSSPAARAAATMGLASAVSRLRASGSSSFPARAPRYTASTSTSESRAAASAAAFRRTRLRVAFDTAAHPEPRVFDSASRRVRPIASSSSPAAHAAATMGLASPASRMKAKHEHRVPLSERAADILDAARRCAGSDPSSVRHSPGRSLGGMMIAERTPASGRRMVAHRRQPAVAGPPRALRPSE